MLRISPSEELTNTPGTLRSRSAALTGTCSDSIRELIVEIDAVASCTEVAVKTPVTTISSSVSGRWPVV